MAKYGLIRFICRKSAFLSPEQIEDYRKDGIVVVDRLCPKLRKKSNDHTNAGELPLITLSHFLDPQILYVDLMIMFQSLDRPGAE